MRLNTKTLPVALALLGLTGIFGGTVLVPCESFVQARPPGDRKGAVIASVNFAVFCGIFVSGPVSNVLNALLTPTFGFAVVGAVILPFGLWLRRALAKEPE